LADREALIRGYAEGLFEIAEAEGELGIVEDELYAFAKALEVHGEVREALHDPALPPENKEGLVRDLLGPRANPNTVNLLTFLIDQGRARDIEAIVEAFARVAAERRARQLAEVRSAVPLDESQQRRLAEALSRATGRAVEVKVVVDPRLIGGIVAKVGDEIFDGSVRSRLAEARERLTRSA
jgi:F-type H+-transporting ATPase subunit delta